MKKAVMGFLGAMLILSLAACTPTSEKNKTGEVKQTEAAEAPKSAQGPGVVTDRPGDPDAPVLEVISIYTVSEDGSKVEGTMESVEELTAQALVDLLIQYEVLDEGTTAVNFEAEGELEAEAAGPGMANSESTRYEHGTLELSQFPEDASELKLQAVANTFIENMFIENVTIQVDGETLVENQEFVEAGK